MATVVLNVRCALGRNCGWWRLHCCCSLWNRSLTLVHSVRCYCRRCRQREKSTGSQRCHRGTSSRRCSSSGWSHRCWTRRERSLHFCRLATLQFFFSQHSKLEQIINSIVFLIVNNVLNLSTQPRIKMINFILCFLMNTSTNHKLLQLSIIVLDRHIPWSKHCN
jgi:hypothetical protein